MSSIRHSDEIDMERQQLEHDLTKILSKIAAYLERAAEMKRVESNMA